MTDKIANTSNATELNVIQVSTGIDNPAAGTTYCIRRLSETLSNFGVSVNVLALGEGAPPSFGDARTHHFAVDSVPMPGFGSLLFSRALKDRLKDLASAPRSVVHSNGLWRMPNIYPGDLARAHGLPLVISPHGMLAKSALQFSRMKKRVFSFALQDRCLRSATCFHATSEAEYEDIRRFGLSAPVAVIPIGIDIPPITKLLGPKVRRTLLYLGRLHPIKNIDVLLAAWSKLEPIFPSWELQIVGPQHENHGTELRGLAARMNLKSVSFNPGLYGEEKSAAIRAADLLILPSRNENFAMVVAEALAHGTPVICSKGAPWAGLETHGCGWWVDHGAEPLQAAMHQAMLKPREALDVMGEKGRAWMAKDFSWDRVASDMIDVYRWCLGQRERPETVLVE